MSENCYLRSRYSYKIVLGSCLITVPVPTLIKISDRSLPFVNHTGTVRHRTTLC